MKIIIISIIVLIIAISIIIGISKKEKVIVIDSDDTKEVMVLIEGEVNKPGFYIVPEKSKVSDAIKLAGGLTDEAYTNDIDNDNYINDGDTIYIKSTNDYYNNIDSKININSCSVNDLMSLSGIGEAKAKAIISYREEHGNFKSIDEIMNVSGISENVFNKIKDYITV